MVEASVGNCWIEMVVVEDDIDIEVGGRRGERVYGRWRRFFLR